MACPTSAARKKLVDVALVKLIKPTASSKMDGLPLVVPLGPAWALSPAMTHWVDDCPPYSRSVVFDKPAFDPTQGLALAPPAATNMQVNPAASSPAIRIKRIHISMVCAIVTISFNKMAPLIERSGADPGTVRMHRNAEVCGQRPGRRRPDQRNHLSTREGRIDL